MVSHLDNRVYAQHKVAFGFLYEYNIQLSLLSTSQDNHAYRRELIVVEASPGVSWQDIVQEFQDFKNGTSTDSYLRTVSTLYHHGIVSLSVSGFEDLSKTLIRKNSEYAVFDQYNRLAKQFVATRDFNAAGGYARRDHKLDDYLPKD